MDWLANFDLFGILGHYKFLAGSSLFTACLCVVLGILILRTNLRDKSCQLTFAFNMSVAVWSFFHFSMYLVTDDALSHLNNQLLTTGAALLTPFLTHLVVIETNHVRFKKWLRINYFFTLALIVLTWLPGQLIVESSPPKLNFPAYTEVGPFYFLLPILMFSNLIASCFLLIHGIRNSTGSRKQQLKLFLIAISVGFAAGTPAYLLTYNIPIKPYTIPLVAVYPTLLTYAIAKHRFLKIEQLIKKTVLFSLLFAASVATLALLLFAFQSILNFTLQQPGTHGNFSLWGPNATGAFHPYVTTGFLTSFVTLAIGAFVFFKNRHSKIQQAFFLLALAISQWSFFTALQSMQTEHAWALIWGRVCHIGVMFIPVFFFYFTGAIVGRMRPALLKFGYILAAILTVGTLFTPVFIPYERTDVGPNFMAAPGPLYALIILFFSVYVLMSLIQLGHETMYSKGLRKKHLQYFFWSSVIGYGMGGINFLPVYGIMIPPYPYTAACGAVYYGILAYAIMRHRLFDIELLVKKGLIFTLLFGTVYSLVTLLIFFLGYFMAGENKALLSIVSILLAMLIYEPLRRTLTTLTHRFLFQKKHDYTRLIDEITQKAGESANLQQISREIVRFFCKEMEVEWAVFYTTSSGATAFHKIASEGSQQLEERMYFKGIRPLFKDPPQPYIMNPFDTDARIPEEARIFTRHHKVEAMVPFFVDRELAALLFLSKKKSDGEFRTEDEIVMKAVMQQASMLLLSGRLLKEIMTSNLELGQRIKMTAITKLAKGVHHEVRNPLHALSLYASATRDLVQRSSETEILDTPQLEELKNRITIMLDQIQHTKNILERFAHFATPTKNETLTRVDLAEEVNNFLVLMKEGHKLDQIEVNTCELKPAVVLATSGAIQEILFNLFTNALEAMKGKGKVDFKIETCGKNVQLTLHDNGPGILPRAMGHLFEAYFTTKQNTEAIGIGLSITKHRVESLGGSVVAKHASSGGAEFIVKLKAA